MRIKLDENLPVEFVEVLRRLSHEADTVQQEGLAGQDDEVIWPVVVAAGRFFITQDLGFSDVRRFVPGSHHGLMVVRLMSAGRRALLDRLTWVFENEPIEEWRGCHVVVTGRKVRIKRPERA